MPPAEKFCRWSHEQRLSYAAGLLSQPNPTLVVANLLIAASAFVDTVESTGGLVDTAGSFYAPAGDPDWIDLADAALAAQTALKASGLDEPLTKHPEQPSDES